MKIQKYKKFTESDTLSFYDEITTNTADHCAAACNEMASCQAFLFVKDGRQCKLTEQRPDATLDDVGYIMGIKPEVMTEDADREGSLEDDLKNDFDTEELLEVQELSRNKLTDEEEQALGQLKQLADVEMAAKYSAPLKELALATRDSVSKKKKKNIVGVIIEVLDETKLEQAVAKAHHQDALNTWYEESWVQKDAINDETDTQATQWNRWQQKRAEIEQNIVASEAQKKAQEAAEEARVMIEDRIKEDERIYGIEETLRLDDLENLVKLNSLLRALYDATKPTGCLVNPASGVICTDKEAGWCVFSERLPSKEQRCSCNIGFYGDICQYKMCPGLGDVLYRHNAEGVCSERGFGGVGGKGCDNTVGECSCGDGYYNGPAKKCEFKHAPPSKYETDGDTYLMGDGVVDDQCSNRGTADKIRGICSCHEAFWGVAPNVLQQNGACETRKCPNSNGVTYGYTSGNACNGHGSCVPESGTCSCQEPYFGHACENTHCPNDCSGNGECNIDTGKCACHTDPIKYTGPSCEFQECPGGCNSPAGQCNRNDGICICKMGYSGETCQQDTRCSAAENSTPETNWWTVWDKPGWVACPQGQLMYALRRGTCDALSCIDSGSCAGACEGDNYQYPLRHCYHDLAWYNSMDKAGWSKCLPDYYVAGLYRSCESLYCLNIAKCCSLKEGRWAGCGQTVWGSSFNNAGWADLGQAGAHAFITGFKRSKAHTISSIDSASYCGFVRGY